MIWWHELNIDWLLELSTPNPLVWHVARNDMNMFVGWGISHHHQDNIMAHSAYLIIPNGTNHIFILDDMHQKKHYNDVIMSLMAYQITSTGIGIVYSAVYSMRKLTKTSKFRVTGLCAGNSPVPSEFPAQMTSYAENVSIWWRHHGYRNDYHSTDTKAYGNYSTSAEKLQNTEWYFHVILQVIPLGTYWYNLFKVNRC